jgi:hypothetical protein
MFLKEIVGAISFFLLLGIGFFHVLILLGYFRFLYKVISGFSKVPS